MPPYNALLSLSLSDSLSLNRSCQEKTHVKHCYKKPYILLTQGKTYATRIVKQTDKQFGIFYSIFNYFTAKLIVCDGSIAQLVVHLISSHRSEMFQC